MKARRAARAAVRAARVRAHRPVERLTRALNRLGPTYVKFGQTLATRPDIVGADVAADLARAAGQDGAVRPGAGAGAADRRRCGERAADLDRDSRRRSPPPRSRRCTRRCWSTRRRAHGRRGQDPAAGHQGSGSAPISRATMPARALAERLVPRAAAAAADRCRRDARPLGAARARPAARGGRDLGVGREHQGRRGLRHPRSQLGPHRRDGADHELDRGHSDPRHRGARCGGARPQGAGAQPAAELPAPRDPRRLLPCRHASGQSLRRSEDRRHHRGRFRHHGPDHPQGAAVPRRHPLWLHHAQLPA